MARLYIESLFPFRLEVVTVLLLAVSAFKVLTSHKNIALSSPAEATFQIEKTHLWYYLRACKLIRTLQIKTLSLTFLSLRSS